MPNCAFALHLHSGVLTGSHVLGVLHTMGLAAHTMGLVALTIGLAALLVEFLGLGFLAMKISQILQVV
jgi:hypothetical protein